MTNSDTQTLMTGAKKLIDNIEFDVNGMHGKGGNGGLTSDETIRSAGELRIILSRMSEMPTKVAEAIPSASREEYFRVLARHYMNALEKIAIEDDVEACQRAACETLGTIPAQHDPEPIGYISSETLAELLHDNSGTYKIIAPCALLLNENIPIYVDADAHPGTDPAPAHQLRGLADAITERVRQIDAEGWTAEHDDSHAHGEMARAAAAYCLGQHELMGRVQDGKRFLPWRSLIWPWSKEWWKPKTRREDLIRAAALIIAEIERLDRAAASEGSKP